MSNQLKYTTKLCENNNDLKISIKKLYLDSRSAKNNGQNLHGSKNKYYQSNNEEVQRYLPYQDA